MEDPFKEIKAHFRGLGWVILGLVAILAAAIGWRY